MIILLNIRIHVFYNQHFNKKITFIINLIQNLITYKSNKFFFFIY